MTHQSIADHDWGPPQDGVRTCRACGQIERRHHVVEGAWLILLLGLKAVPCSGWKRGVSPEMQAYRDNLLAEVRAEMATRSRGAA